MSEPKNMTYAGTGVNFDVMDTFKRKAQQAASQTDDCIGRLGYEVVSWTRGESVFLVETPYGYLAFVVEGLGTKNLVAAAMCKLAINVLSLTGKSFFANVAICNAAMAFNDLITLGATPVMYGQYLAVGNSDRFKNERWCEEIVEGTKEACLSAQCVWGGGETPTLKGIIEPSTEDLAGATVGVITPKSRLINPAYIQHGDAIIIVESSGIHANGLTLARKIADKLPDGYLATLPTGRTYGETLLDPTVIYVKLVQACLDLGIPIHYTVNITGHGWRKLMRATQSFIYVVETLPTQLPIFDFLQKHGPVDDEEAYGNLNMGAGFALYVDPEYADTVTKVARHYGYEAFVAGHIERGPKSVVIKPKGLTYSGETLAVR